MTRIILRVLRPQNPAYYANLNLHFKIRKCWSYFIYCLLLFPRDHLNIYIYIYIYVYIYINDWKIVLKSFKNCAKTIRCRVKIILERIKIILNSFKHLWGPRFPPHQFEKQIKIILTRSKMVLTRFHMILTLFPNSCNTKFKLCVLWLYKILNIYIYVYLYIYIYVWFPIVISKLFRCWAGHFLCI